MDARREAIIDAQVSAGDLVVWDDLIRAYLSYLTASKAFMAPDVPRVALVRHGLRRGHRATALSVLTWLSTAELMELFPDLVYSASTAHGAIDAVREVILALPHDWVLARIEREAEPFLAVGGEDEYRRFLELYRELDMGLILALARRAAAHPDPEVREAGDDFLQRTR